MAQGVSRPETAARLIYLYSIPAVSQTCLAKQAINMQWGHTSIAMCMSCNAPNVCRKCRCGSFASASWTSCKKQRSSASLHNNSACQQEASYTKCSHLHTFPSTANPSCSSSPGSGRPSAQAVPFTCSPSCTLTCKVSADGTAILLLHTESKHQKTWLVLLHGVSPDWHGGVGPTNLNQPSLFHILRLCGSCKAQTQT